MSTRERARAAPQEENVPARRVSTILPDGHLEHLKEHLRRLKEGQANVPDPERMFLGREEERHFWELIGFRLAGHPSTILAAVRFRRHDFPGEAYARDSLPAFLSAKGIPGSGSLPRPAGSIPVLLPRTGDDICSFLGSLRAGRTQQQAHVDPASIDVAFDFRMNNPFAVEALRRTAAPLVRRAFRTTRGHLLTAASHDPCDAAQSGDFLALKSPIQHSARGQLGLPNLAVNQRFLAMTASIGDNATRLAATQWMPFSPATGVTRHILLE